MILSDYVRELGIAGFAKKFRVSERAARSYKEGTRRPRLAVARRIRAASTLSLDDIYSGARKG